MTIEPESFEQAWSLLTSKVRDRWPKLTNADIDEINGKLDRLVKKVNDYYGLTRSEVLQELTTFLQPAQTGEMDVHAGEPKLGEHSGHSPAKTPR